MTGIKHTVADYRYPGSRPFDDTPADRRLFFGRDQEKTALLHKVLAHNLVVLYARSGVGKTSLLNAGLKQLLRDRGFMPVTIRFNDPRSDPLQSLYAEIKETADQWHLDYDEGEKETPWQYFKTAAFWSSQDTLLTPVLIFDQFEDFFAFHPPEDRDRFIGKLADVVHNTIPQELREAVQPDETFPYSDRPPQVKIIISIREDHLGELEEMSRHLPAILHQRFRLLPLTRQQAHQAITEPCRVKDDAVGPASFRFSDEAVEQMLNFLCQRKEREGIRITDEVEPFQLQLLCRHLEEKVGDRGAGNGETEAVAPEVTIQPSDLGGEAGMQKVLQRFYLDQLKQLDSLWKRRRVRNLCEKGLISASDRRLSLEVDEIKHKFKVSEETLQELVDRRLLRAEPRVGSIYYELSHDTLIPPIRYHQQHTSERNVNTTSLLLICILLIYGLLLMDPSNSNRNEALTHYLKGQKLQIHGKAEEALEYYRKAIKLNPENANAYYNMGIALADLKKYPEAIEAYKKAIQLDPKYAYAYNNMGIALKNLRKYPEAIEAYKKAIQLDPKYAHAYYNMGIALADLKKYSEAIEAYQKAIQLGLEYINAKANLAEIYILVDRFDEALGLARKVLAEKGISVGNNLGIRFVIVGALVFQREAAEAKEEVLALIRYYRSLSGEYERGWRYTNIKAFIRENDTLGVEERQLLLMLIDILESPKKEGEARLRELEIAAERVFK